MSFDISLIAAQAPEIARGLLITLLMWAAGAALAFAFGFGVAVLRRYGPRPLDWALRLYMEVMRGTPFLIQIFLLYFGGPFIGLSLNPVPAGLIGLTLYGAAYFSEIFRSGFEAVPKGHVEAAECVGLSRAQIVRRILIPEMTMLVLPPSVNMTVILLKETAVLSLITVPELTMIVSAIGSQQYAFIESYFLLALSYWGFVELTGMAGRAAERRFARLRFAQ